MIERGEKVIVLRVDGGGGDQDVRLFADWAEAKRAFKATLAEFETTTFEVENLRGRWWAYPDVGATEPWVELKRVAVE